MIGKTPTEAREKFCPIGIRGGYLCSADSCMAWVWSEYKVSFEDEELVTIDGLSSYQQKEFKQNIKGYCGMVK